MMAIITIFRWHWKLGTISLKDLGLCQKIGVDIDNSKSDMIMKFEEQGHLSYFSIYVALSFYDIVNLFLYGWNM